MSRSQFLPRIWENAFARISREAVKTLQARLAAEQDPLVKQDLEILIDAAQRNIRSSAAYEEHELPYSNAGRQIFSGMEALLQDQVAPERRRAAVVRLRRYAGVENGFTPTTVLSEKLFREKLNVPGLIGPPKAEVEQDLAQADSFVTGIGLASREIQDGRLRGRIRQAERPASRIFKLRSQGSAAESPFRFPPAA